MIANINARGTSFKGVTAYLMHDKKAQTSERVAWSETRNLHTENIENASKVMAYTDMNAESLKRSFGGSVAGVKRESGAVYHFSLSEDPKNSPTQKEWAGYVDSNIEKLGLSEHQYYMVAHNDEDHAHVHVVVNLVHPETGKINSLHNDYKKMDRLAHEYELKNGIVCEDRNRKYEAWEAKKRAFKEKENREEYAIKVTSAFKQSDNSQSFKSALEHEGLTLSQGSRRSFVLVDTQGQIFALNRLIKFDDNIQRKEKNQQINNKLKGIDKNSLPVADKLQEQRQFIDRDAEEIKQQRKLLDAAEIAGKKKAENQEIVENIKEKEKAQAALSVLKKQREQEKSEQSLKREKIAKYEHYLAGKIKDSRKKWDIEKFTQERDQAKEELQRNSGFFARLRGKKRAASDKLEAQQKTLEERLGRFKTDIIHYNKKRPQWVIDKELKKQGFESEKIRPENAQAAQVKKQVQQKDQGQKQEDKKLNLDDLTPAQKRVVTASPEQIKEVVKAQAEQKQSISSASFMDSLSDEQKAKIKAYKQSNPEQDNEKKGYQKGQSPDLE